MEQLKSHSASLLHQEKRAKTTDGMKPQTPKFLRQRKFFMVLPLLMLPFMTFMFWALGGGKMENVKANAEVQKGFNMTLPDAYLKEDKSLNKMSYYDKADSDSAKAKKLMKSDPYYNNREDFDGDREEANSIDTSFFQYRYKIKNSGLKTSPYSSSLYNDPNEAKVYEKLDQLNKVLNNPPISEVKPGDQSSYNHRETASVKSEDVDRLEQMMQTMNESHVNDPEMQQLNSILEKILDIQHPDRLSEKTKQTSEERKGKVFPVTAKDPSDFVSLLDNDSFNKVHHDTDIRLSNQSNAFYSFEDLTVLNESPNAIEAVIHETQTLVNGSTVKLRLTNDVYINGVLIPKDNFLFGTASLNGERLNIKISSIRFHNSLFPVELSVYDMDGIDGIYIPGAISRDVAKQSIDRSTQGLGLTTLDPSLGAQAANAGIEAARNLLSKKVKLIKVTVKAGYRVLLKSDQQKN
jgi:conjugative transposon TraM protein